MICRKRIFLSGKVRHIQILPFARMKILYQSIFCVLTPSPDNHPHSSGKVVVKNVQIWHHDVQPEIMQSSNQINSRGRHDSSDLFAHKIRATVRRAVWAGALSCWNTNGWFLLPNMFSTESRKFSDQILAWSPALTFSQSMIRLPTPW